MWKDEIQVKGKKGSRSLVSFIPQKHPVGLSWRDFSAQSIFGDFCFCGKLGLYCIDISRETVSSENFQEALGVLQQLSCIYYRLLFPAQSPFIRDYSIMDGHSGF